MDFIKTIYLITPIKHMPSNVPRIGDASFTTGTTRKTRLKSTNPKNPLNADGVYLQTISTSKLHE